MTGGNNNTALGIDAGSGYNGFESDNITIAHSGVNGESNVTRIGTNGNQLLALLLVLMALMLDLLQLL